MNPVRAFFKWLTVENHLLYNPAADLEVPRTPRQLPKVLLTIADVEQVLAQPDVDTPMGLRNRAMLKTLYSTGIRRLESPDRSGTWLAMKSSKPRAFAATS